MKRFRKVYLEISNVCNLKCAFCPGTKRRRYRMDESEFTLLAQKLRPWTDYLYFHLMGEPLCHPKLESFLQIADELGFRVILTTNGTLIQSCRELLLNAPALHKVNISLHAFEANDIPIPFETYLSDCFEFGKSCAGSVILCYRLWNQGGAETMNSRILSRMEEAFPKPWIQQRQGIRIGERTYLEYGEKFDWPDLNAEQSSDRCFCYGLRDQIGVLCDGTVVPCCLDHEGDIPLGNLLRQDLEEILDSPRAKAIYAGFSQGTAAEELCRRCGYARRFTK